MEAIISLLTFLAVVCLIIGLHRLSVKEQERIHSRLNNITKGLKDDAAIKDRNKLKFNFSSLLSFMGKKFINLSFSKKMETKLAKADILMRSEEFIGLNILTTVGGALFGMLFFGRGSPMLVLAILGMIIPWLVVTHKQRQRAALLNSEIGECLTGMSNSLRAGYSFQQAIDLVSKETIGPLAIEFRRTLREINLGITTEQALHNLIQRVEDDDLELIIGAVLIQRQVGGNLAEIFDNIAETIRQRIRLQGDVRTLTAQGRISGIIVALLPVALAALIMVIDPHYMAAFFASRVGWFLMGGAIISEVIGFLFMRKITDIHL